MIKGSSLRLGDMLTGGLKVNIYSPGCPLGDQRIQFKVE